MGANDEKRNDGKIVERDIEKEMRTAYIDYAMSVIVARALPDVRDGLKPVHRRILYAMYEDGITSLNVKSKIFIALGIFCSMLFLLILIPLLFYKIHNLLIYLPLFEFCFLLL